MVHRSFVKVGINMRLLMTFILSIYGIQTLGNQKVADVALAWFKCPPTNPYVASTCKTACCYGGSNWDLTCIGFTDAVTMTATGKIDPELRAGFPQAGQTFGSAITSFEAMKTAGRAHLTSSDVPPGAAVYFEIKGFIPGHIAINSGIKDSSGDPLIVSTGGANLTGIRLMPLSVLSRLPGWKYLGWADL
jgi:hypothetical protein